MNRINQVFFGILLLGALASNKVSITADNDSGYKPLSSEDSQEWASNVSSLTNENWDDAPIVPSDEYKPSSDWSPFPASSYSPSNPSDNTYAPTDKSLDFAAELANANEKLEGKPSRKTVSFYVTSDPNQPGNDSLDDKDSAPSLLENNKKSIGIAITATVITSALVAAFYYGIDPLYRKIMKDNPPANSDFWQKASIIIQHTIPERFQCETYKAIVQKIKAAQLAIARSKASNTK